MNFYGEEPSLELKRKAKLPSVENKVDFASFILFFNVFKSLEEQRRRVMEFIEMMGKESGDVRYLVKYLLLIYDNLVCFWKEKQEKRR